MWIIQERWFDVDNRRASAWMNLPDAYFWLEEAQHLLKVKRHLCSNSPKNLTLSSEYRIAKLEVLDD